MSVETQHLQYRNIIVALQENGFSSPILATDFKTIKMSMNLIDSPDFELVVYGSFNPSYGPIPDVTGSPADDNEFHLLAYTDNNEALFDTATPFNPAGTAGDYSFNIETTGENWIVIGIANYSAGQVEFMHADLYSNFN